jgi:hypothetical protein
MTLQAWHICICGVSPILLKLCQVAWGALLHSYFQVSPEMFLPLKNITHSMMLPPPCFTIGMVPGFFQT